MTSYIKKLPEVFQTITEKKFFDATFDQVFSKKDSDLLYGYIGRRVPGHYDPVNDFYLPEPSKDRTRWQLEATSFSRNADSTKSNIFFYDDLLNRIKYYGGDILNQDRLFESRYYSWAPPIDFDMFVNYQNYHWVSQGLETIDIYGVRYSDIVTTTGIEPLYFNTNMIEGSTPMDLTLVPGLCIRLVDDPEYPGPMIVENFGGSAGLQLAPKRIDYTSGSNFEFLPWDGSMQTPDRRYIFNTKWDAEQAWDIEPMPGDCDYITIERGCGDQNAWSRTNRWFSAESIAITSQITKKPSPANAIRALRPIIQFSVNLELYQSGKVFKCDVTYGFMNNIAGTTAKRADFEGETVEGIASHLQVDLQDGDLVVFMNDSASKRRIWQVSISDLKIVSFLEYSSLVVNGDIILTTHTVETSGARRGQSWFYDAGAWVHAFNDKATTNQPPLFQLYDHSGVALDDPVVYPVSSFAGSKIFSYKVATTQGTRVDPVLNMAIVYTALGQSSDIMFQNNLITDRYTYNSTTKIGASIDGYYYYTVTGSNEKLSDWHLYTPIISDEVITPKNTAITSKQRVTDTFVVGYGSEYKFNLSVVPYGYSTDPELMRTPDIIVSVNNIEIKNSDERVDGYIMTQANNTVQVDLQTYLANLLLTPQIRPPVVQIDIYTHGLLAESAPGYFNIPQQLEANPNQLEVSDISASNLINQFTSIIRNQDGFIGLPFGGQNNYRHTRKNRSLGEHILQNTTPMLKSMLISSDTDLDIISGIRFSQDEYTKFKNRFLKTAQQLINQEFNPLQYHRNTIVVSEWVDEIIKTVNVSREFSSAFAHSYMIAHGSPKTSYRLPVPASGIITVNTTIDLTDDRNTLYAYRVGDREQLLLSGIDYTIMVSPTTISLTFAADVSNVYIAIYTAPLPAYIASTPTKLGAYGTFVPRVELDTTYTIPTLVIIGHDGSKSIAYGDYNDTTYQFTDYRDALLLELEKRIYNSLHDKFRKGYRVPLILEEIKEGYFRETRYSRSEYLEITAPHLNKWAAKNLANYRANDFKSSSEDLPDDSPELWKLYNYRSKSSEMYYLPGNWKGIYQYYYDTIYPDTRPWEMLGFSDMPSWWDSEYGSDTSSANTKLWYDLEAGIILHGPSAIYDSEFIPQAQAMWARPWLSEIIPVDESGNIRSIIDIFDLSTSEDKYAPFDGYDDEWIYGDGSPVEQAWMSTSGYAFSVQEFLYLMRPAAYGEYFFDTVGTTVLTSKMSIDVEHLSNSSTNWQYVQNDAYSSTDPLFAWMRPKNNTQVVHAEVIDGATSIRYGYQRWISDYILFLGKNVTDTFGQKIRTLDVNLANKLAGFTNKDTTSTYIESVSASTTTTSLLVPTNNFEVILHKGQPIKLYSYSGIIVRAMANGQFVVYGYDLLNSSFEVMDRSNMQRINITIGGTPAPFRPYVAGDTYHSGDIVRYNGVFYLSNGTILANKFDNNNWQKLTSLPTVGGVEVVHRPRSESTSHTVPYGTVLNTVQEVFDVIIGWGDYLTSQGWQFTEVSSESSLLNDWLYCAKQFLYWLNTNWAPDASIQLSPGANKVMLTIEHGYPDDIETISNGIYSILDKYGVAIPTISTTIDRDGRYISVSPVDDSVGGIYFLQVTASETEHILIFDNVTSFNDTIFDPLLRERQQRLRFNGRRSNGWYGKKVAPGYLIMDNQLLPNYDTITDAMRHYYDPDVTIDNPSLEALGRHLIGYESKSYLDNLQISNDVQYLFYQGAIRQKGTVQAFDKLFRSTKAQGDETIEVYEEWALKLGDFGNTVEQVSTEFILKPEQNSGEVIVARLNFVPSTIGYVKQVDIFNAENKYSAIPKLILSDPNWSIPNARLAKAFAILGATGTIIRVDISDPGYGYLSAPTVTINSSSTIYYVDVLYAVWQGEIIRDTAIDNIIEIDIDDTAKWTVRPADPIHSLEFPVTNQIEYLIPNAGYVNFNDVTWGAFDVAHTYAQWGSSFLNPTTSDTVWVANNYIGDWDVYKMVSIESDEWSITQNPAGNLELRTGPSVIISPQLSFDSGSKTDFGNTICLQVRITTERHDIIDITVPQASNFIVTFEEANYQDPYVIGYNSYNLLTSDGVPISATDVSIFNEFNTLLLFKTMRFVDIPTEIPQYIKTNNKIWVDRSTSENLWSVLMHTPYNDQPFATYRKQEPLIDTTLFESAQIYENTTGVELATLPIYDPFKGILPASAKLNITYMLMRDPAKYNITGDSRLFSDTIIFGEQQVGKLWWDLSTVRYAYYEQPRWLNEDGTYGEDSTEHLVYRRDNWGAMFPGSTISIYEWTKSIVPPEKYTGSGTPKSNTSYVQITTSNRFTNIQETNYYFWVLNSSYKPNIKHRTMTGLDVARMLTSPKSQGFTFFNPIQQTTTYNSYMFYNVQDILSYRGNHVQVKYRLAQRNDQKHTQWKFFRENDKNSLVTDQFWDKMVDSLCGYTKSLPDTTTDWKNIILVDGSPILPVPDPALSDLEKYGIGYRPLQSMFVNKYEARRVFVQACNQLLKHVPIRVSNENWNNGTDTDPYEDIYWSYTDWYEIGFEEVTPTVVFSTLAEAQAALMSGSLSTGTIVEVLNGTVNGQFVLYSVIELSTSVSTQSFRRVGIGAAAIKLLNSVYTVNNIYQLSLELRHLLSAIRTTILVDEFSVGQNELYFSMLNYVFSEQRTPNWVFKTSYIYVKENNIPLSQSALYVPDQIDNIIGYIKDVKPYHTHIRDYTSVYTTSDVADGTVTGDFLVYVDTRLPVKVIDGMIYPWTTMGDVPDLVDPIVAEIIANSTLDDILYSPGHWDADDVDPTIDAQWDTTSWDAGPVYYLPATVSYSQNLGPSYNIYLRNGDVDSELHSEPDTSVWNAIDADVDATTEIFTDVFTSIERTSIGGIWYANTAISTQLTESPGALIPEIK